MSINIDLDSDLQSVTVETVVNDTVTENNSYEITPVESVSIVEGVKREYSIVGDGLYASISTDEAPEWLTTIIDNLVTTSIADGQLNYDLLVQDVRNAIDAIDVAQNTYVEQVNINALIDGIVVTKIETLNATLGDTYATRVELTTASATTTDALTLYTTDLVSSFNDDVNARVTNVELAYTTADSALSSSIEALSSSIVSQNEELSANANAVSGLKTYVGLGPTNDPDGTGVLSRVQILENQNDGVVEYVTGTYDVMIGVTDPNTDTTDDDIDETVEPYVSWITIDAANSNDLVRQDHIGDVFIQYDAVTGNYVKAYKFIKTSQDVAPPFATDAEGYTWALITDTDAANALVIALQAQDLADGKRRVFVGLGATNTPATPYDLGDLWLIDAARTIDGQSAAVGDIFRAIEVKGSAATYEQNDWVVASSYVAAVNAEAVALELWKTNVYGDFVTGINSQVDQKAESFYQELAPRPVGPEATNPDYSEYIGDLWKVPSTNQEYIYQLVGADYVWVETDVPDSVYDTIDGKKAIYVGNVIPIGTTISPIQINDMWITGNAPPNGYDLETIYVATSLDPVVWAIPVKYTDDSGLVTLSNGLANGTIVIDLSASTIDGTTSITDYVANQSDNEVVVYSGNDYTEITTAKLDDLYIESKVETLAGVTGDVSTVTIYKCTTGFIADPATNCVWTAQTNASASLADLADLADGKRTIFSNVSNDVPVGAVNDLWIPKTGTDDATYVPGEVYQNDGAGWVLATKYTENLNTFVEDTYTPDSAQLHRQLDGKVEYYFYDTFNDDVVIVGIPSIAAATDETTALAIIDTAWNTQELKDDANGNIVYFIDSKNAFWYKGSTGLWLSITDTSIYQALELAAQARGAADGKVSQFYAWDGTNAPADVVYVTNPTDPVEDQVTETIAGSTFLYWLKNDNNLYYKPSTTWDLVPVISGTGGVYVSEGDVLTGFNPVTRDYSSYTYNGTSWQLVGPDGIISSSEFFVNLSNDVRASTGLIGSALTQLSIDSNAYTDGEIVTAQSNFDYDSTLQINGVYYKSGFGLNSAGAGSLTQPGGADGLGPTSAFDSEFYVNAERFVLKSPSYPAVSAVFQVTETGISLGVEHTDATRNEAKGNYLSTTTYAKGDVVTYEGSSYTALRVTVNDTPSDSPLDWQLLALAGTPGIQRGVVLIYADSTSGLTPSLTQGTKEYINFYEWETGTNEKPLVDEDIPAGLTYVKTGGTNGEDARSVDLIPSVSALAYNTAGDLVTSSVTFTATPKNTIGVVTYEFFVNGTTQGATNTYTPPASYLATPISIRVDLKEDGIVRAQDEVTLYPVKSGSDVLTAILKNDTHVIPASFDGSVGSYAGSGTTVEVLQGATSLTYETGTGTPSGNSRFRVEADSSGAVPEDIAIGAVSGTGTTKATYADASAMVTDSAVVTYTIHILNDVGQSSTITKTQSLSKAKAAQGSGVLPIYADDVDGDNADLVREDRKFVNFYEWTAPKPTGVPVDVVGTYVRIDGIVGDNAQVVKLTGPVSAVSYNTEGEIPSVATIEFTATPQGVILPFYEFFIEGGTQGTSSGAVGADLFTYTVPTTYSSSPVSIRVEVREASATGTIVATDEVTVYSVKSGKDVYTAVVSNDTHTVPTDKNGNNGVFTGSGSEIRVYQGSTLLTFDAIGATYPSLSSSYNINRTFINLSANALTGTSTTVATQPDYISAGADVGTATFTIRVKNTEGIEVPAFSKVQTITKSKQGEAGIATNGLNTAIVYLYRRATSTPAKPTTQSTYVFATSALSGFGSDWSLSIPTTSTDPIYVIAATASDSGTSDTIEGTEWSDPAILASNGINGLNSATISIYQRKTSLPALPTATITHTFNPPSTTSPNNGWTLTVPEGVESLYISTATAVSSTNTDGILVSEWAVPKILAKDGVTAKTLTVTANSQTMSFSKAGVVQGTNPVVVTANPQNLGGSVVWTTDPDSAGTANVNTYTIQPSFFASNTSVLVTATQDGLSDSTTITKLQDGIDSISVVQTNESHTFTASTAGTISSTVGSGGEIRVYEGATLLPFVTTVTGNGQWKINTPYGITGGITHSAAVDSGSFATLPDILGMTGDSGILSIPIEGTSSNGTSFSTNVIRSFSKSKQGIPGDPIEVQYSQDTTAANFSAGFAAGDLYMRQRVGTGDWTTPIRIVGENGDNGAYTDYTFAKNTTPLTAPTIGFTDAPPALAAGEHLWMKSVKYDINGSVVAEGTSTVRISGDKGDSATLYKIRIPDGTGIKNGTGTITLTATEVVGGVQTDLVAGDIQLYKASDQTPYLYTETFNAAAISGSLDVILKDSVTNYIYDSVTLVDVTDGLDAYQSYLEWTGTTILSAGASWQGQTNAQSSSWTQAANAGAWSPVAIYSEYDTVFVRGGIELARRRTVVKRTAGNLDAVKETPVSSATNYTTGREWSGRTTPIFTAAETLILSGTLVHSSQPISFTAISGGSKGDEGDRGTAVLTYNADLGATTTTGAVTTIATYWNAVAPAALADEISGDTLVVTNTNETTGWTHIYSYGTEWTSSVAFTVNGDQVVTGTLAGDRLIAGTEISAPIISGGTIKGVLYQTVGSNFMVVQSANTFGPNNLIDWYGPVAGNLDANGNAILANLTKVNAVTWKDDLGNFFTQGTIITGALTVAKQSPAITNSPSVQTNSFGSNGGQIAINCSVFATFNSDITAGTCPAAPATPSVTLRLYDDAAGGVLVNQQVFTGTYECRQEGPEYITEYAVFGSFTFIDNQLVTTNRDYRLNATISNIPTSPVAFRNQRLSILTQEGEGGSGGGGGSGSAILLNGEPGAYYLNYANFSGEPDFTNIATDILSSGDTIQIGKGGGSVALTVNDGKGNANVTFNHASGVPEVSGASGRIEVNVDSADANDAHFSFELASQVTAGASIDLTQKLFIGETYSNFAEELQVGSSPVLTSANFGQPEINDLDITAYNSGLLNGVASGTASVLNTIVKRDASANIRGNTFKASVADQNTIDGAMAFRSNNSTLDHVRFCDDVGAIRTYLSTYSKAEADAQYAPLGSDTGSGVYLPLSGGTLTGQLTVNQYQKFNTKRFTTSGVGREMLYLGVLSHGSHSITLVNEGNSGFNPLKIDIVIDWNNVGTNNTDPHVGTYISNWVVTSGAAEFLNFHSVRISDSFVAIYVEYNSPYAHTVQAGYTSLSTVTNSLNVNQVETWTPVSLAIATNGTHIIPTWSKSQGGGTSGLTYLSNAVYHAGNFGKTEIDALNIDAASLGGTPAANYVTGSTAGTTFVNVSNTQTISGAKTFSALLTADAGISTTVASVDKIKFNAGVPANDDAAIEWLGASNAGFLRFSTADDNGTEYMQFGDYDTAGQVGTFTEWLKVSRAGATFANSVTAPTFIGTATNAKWIDFPDGPRDLSDRLPNWNARSVAWDFVRNEIVGGTGSYAGVMTFAPWSGTTGSTGDASYQLAFCNGTGTSASGIPSLRIRNGIDTTWNSFHTVWHSGNFGKTEIDALNIDADTLDSLHASSFVRSDVDDTKTGKLWLNGQITSSSAVLQVNGFQRTGSIYLHEGASPNVSYEILENVLTDLKWKGNLVYHDGNSVDPRTYGVGTSTTPTLTDFTVSNPAGLYRCILSTATGGPDTVAYNAAVVVQKGINGSGDTFLVTRSTGTDSAQKMWFGSRTAATGAVLWKEVWHGGNLVNPTVHGLGTLSNTEYPKTNIDDATCPTGFYRVINTNPSTGTRPTGFNTYGYIQVQSYDVSNKLQIYTDINGLVATRVLKPAGNTTWKVKLSDGDTIDATTVNSFSLSKDNGNANTIAQRNGSGDIHARLLRSSYGNESTISGALAFRVNNTSDNYNRYCSDRAAIRSWLDLYNKGEADARYVNLTGNNMTGSLKITRNGTDNLVLQKTTDTDYTGLTWADANATSRWLLYTSNNAQGNLSLQGRRADGVYQHTSLTIDNNTGVVSFGFAPTVAGNVLAIASDYTTTTAGLRSLTGVPASVWTTSTDVMDVAGIGILGTEGSFKTSWTWNGYRNTSSGFTYRGVDGNTTTASNLEHDSSSLSYRAGVAVGTTLPEIFSVTNLGAVTTTGHIHVKDSKYLYLGNSNDLRVRHDGTNSTIDNVTGSLYLRSMASAADVFLEATRGATRDRVVSLEASATETRARLSWNGQSRFYTDSIGAVVQGRLRVVATDGLLEVDSTTNTDGVEATLRLNSASKQGCDIRLNTFDSNIAPFGVHIERAADNTQTSSKAYLSVQGNLYMDGDTVRSNGKTMFETYDTWLRINDEPSPNSFSSGIYCGTGIIRTDGEFQSGSGGSRFKITTAGVVTALGTITGTDAIATSDIRVKQDLQPITNAAEKLKTLRTTTHERTDYEKVEGKYPRKASVIAQDVEAVLPEAISYTDDKELGQKLNVSVPATVVMTIAAVNEHTDTIATQAKKIASLEDRLAKLEALLING